MSGFIFGFPQARYTKGYTRLQAGNPYNSHLPECLTPVRVSPLPHPRDGPRGRSRDRPGGRPRNRWGNG